MITFNHDYNKARDGVFRTRIKFPNGWAVSIVGGNGGRHGVYSQNIGGAHIPAAFPAERFHATEEFESVEIAIVDPNGGLVTLKSGDTVKGWVKTPELLEMLCWAAKQ
jgi:hypothetical protein